MLIENAARASAPSPGMLVASGYGVAFGPRVILADLHFEIASQGITVLMGPVGTGKSTLLRSTVGLNNPSVNFRQWGRVEYGGQIAGPTNCPMLVQQHARLLSQPVYENLIHGIRGQWHQGALELRQHVTQVLSVDVLQHQKQRAVLSASKVRSSDDVDMLQMRRREGFTLKARHHLGVLHHLVT